MFTLLEAAKNRTQHQIESTNFRTAIHGARPDTQSCSESTRSSIGVIREMTVRRCVLGTESKLRAYDELVRLEIQQKFLNTGAGVFV